MIKITFEDGVYAPQVFCDRCGERIEAAKEGNYEWSGAENDVLFAHKDCSRALEAARRSIPGAWCTEELTLLPLFLGNNLSLNWDEAWKQLRERVEFGFAGP